MIGNVDVHFQAVIGSSGDILESNKFIVCPEHTESVMKSAFGLVSTSAINVSVMLQPLLMFVSVKMTVFWPGVE